MKIFIHHVWLKQQRKKLKKTSKIQKYKRDNMIIGKFNECKDANE